MRYNRRTQPSDIPDCPTPEELADLDKLILAHRHLYYGGHRCAITDYEYDLLENRVKKVAPETSVVHQVGGPSDDPVIIAIAKTL